MSPDSVTKHHASKPVYQVKDDGDDLKTGVIKGVKIPIDRKYSYKYNYSRTCPGRGSKDGGDGC